MNAKLPEKSESNDASSESGSARVRLDRYDLLFAITFTLGTIAVLLMLHSGRLRIMGFVVASLVVVIAFLFAVRK
ncbi:MAG: hypothetical protein ACYS21_15745 [Planctomycetota bacterium]|jgi:hypothetical protein